jgi:pyruvate/2-oxoglutarate dehydrogenase complex dihydrolipoamide acyltransferase (E2) component
MAQWTVDVPKFDDGSREARVVAWHYEVGDLVAVDALLVEVETQKAVFEVVATKTGYLAAKVVATGVMAKAETPLAAFTDKKS